MMFEKIFLPLIVIILLAPIARAQNISIFIEPYLGGSQMSFNYLDTPESDNAYILGGKGGIAVSNSIFLGFDYHTGGPYEFENYKDAINITNPAATVPSSVDECRALDDVVEVDASGVISSLAPLLHHV